jgi:hypothetical protein
MWKHRRLTNLWAAEVRYYDQYTPNHTNSVTLSPQTNYTDWATATCWGYLVPTFVDRGVSRDKRGGSPEVVSLSFLDRSRYFCLRSSHLSSQGWVDPVPDPLLLRKSGCVGNRTRDLWISSQKLWPLDHRGGHDDHTFMPKYYQT